MSDNHPLYIWCIAYLGDARDSDNEAIDSSASDDVLKREANKLEKAIYMLASSFVDNEFSDVPVDLHGTLNPAFTDGPDAVRFKMFVKQPELDEEPGWKYKIHILDNKYLDSDGLPITAIAGGDNYVQASKHAGEMIEEARNTDACTF